MSDKPSYLGLLNAISLAESAAHEYLECWIAVTPSDEVRSVLQCVSAREGEHGKAFAKRISELGYTLRPKDDPGRADRMKWAASTKLSDLEKMEKFGLGRLDTGDKPDIFDGFFKDHSIDIRTGELLGRYIAEERDSGRLLKSCYEQLKAASNGKHTSTNGHAEVDADRLAVLESKIDAICDVVTRLSESVTTSASPKPRTRATASTNGRTPAKRKSRR